MPMIDWYTEYELLDEYAEELAVFADYVNDLNLKEYQMDSVNRVELEGFVASEPYFKAFADGNSVSHLSLGVVKYFKGENDSLERKISFVPIDVFNPEIAFQKGDELKITGSLIMDRWKDNNDEWRSKLKVRARRVTFR